jgi:DNA repair exonuclease SbcCD nuclease subunit
MKAVIINDTHFGYKADSSIILDYFLSFFEKQMFPYMIENKIKTIFHLGDLFDRRKYINFKTLNQVRERFFEPLNEQGIRCHIICGNHDTFYRNTNKVNSLSELAGNYFNWSIYSEPKEIELEYGKIALLPWINSENEEETINFLKECTSSVLLGHLELYGFQSMRGVFVEQGYDHKHFDKFEYVLTGHYHVKSSRDNIHYLGTQYQMAYSDVWEEKGFHVFDFKNRTLEFVQNAEKLFYTLDYNEDSTEKLNYAEYKDKYVKIFIKNKTKQNQFEKYIDKFYEAGVAELQIAEEVSSNPELVAVDIHKDTLQLLHEELETINEKSVNKNTLAEIINTAYNSALSKDEE